MYNATRNPQEVNVKYGSRRFVPLDPVRFTATVCSDKETMYRPAIYKISGFKPMDAESELLMDKIPVQVVSNIGCYRNIAKDGEQIKVAGKLERVESTVNKDFYYHVVVGTATSEEEYIWPL